MNEVKDVFISYNWNVKNEVKYLDKKLTESGVKVFLDDKALQTNDLPLSIQLTNEIKKSKIFLCCITKDYCKSLNCNLEFEYANTIAKPIVVLMIDDLKPCEINDTKINNKRYSSGIGFMIE